MTTIFFTNTGFDRDANEDAVLAGGLYGGGALSMDAPMVATEPGAVLAVADGMGGGPGGAQASVAVLEGLRRLSPAVSGADDTGRGLILENLYDTVGEYDRMALERPDLLGMGATVAGVWRLGDSALVFNCGDCRVYRQRRGLLEMLTRDHSRVYGLYLDGLIDFEDIRTHPQRHLITSAVQQGNPRVELFTRLVRLDPLDVFFICSDGVWESLDDDFLEECLAADSLEDGALILADSLVDANCGDNVSFLLHGPDNY
ncbi:MAG: serine/threonine-protein phosphatase [Deltaproteobacteria bacterium]|jgi:serine/threonine protein phosphatase PrpC|nr:serine/threonine-protein phosphatase [Deltaproteobacteria bacterium]